jgi:hypothetical protein
VRRRIARWAAALAACVLVPAVPAAASGESLKVSMPRTGTVGQPLTITVTGTADGSHRLYVFADEGQYNECGSNPQNEYSESARVTALSGVEGEVLAAGAFSKSYSYTPTYRLPTLCAYLDDTISHPPDAFATLGDPVNEYLENREEAQATSSWSGPGPGAIEAPAVNPQAEKEFWEHLQARLREEAESRARAQSVPRPAPHAAYCVVPSLKGRTLTGARTALRHHHCKLGKVTIRRHAHRGLLVVGQSRSRGTRLHDGAAVSVTIA